jgi:uncharacterized membrane protein
MNESRNAEESSASNFFGRNHPMDDQQGFYAALLILVLIVSVFCGGPGAALMWPAVFVVRVVRRWHDVPQANVDHCNGHARR